MRGWFRATLFLLIPILAASCSSVPAKHNGRKGLFARFGQLEPANRSVDRSPAYAAREEDDGRPGAVEAEPEGETQADTAADIGGLNLKWPLQSIQVTSGFGKRGREFHEGVDLRAHTGTPVFAAAAGRVIYAGRKIKGYGNLIVLRHDQGVATVYAHNSKLLVKPGDRVHLGQKIAISGKSGRVSGPHLHFEVRKGVAAVDPMRCMPKPSTGTTASTMGPPIPETSGPLHSARDRSGERRLASGR
jgi:murein DD-endopeptidase MepM/ murein hydrolase activator NlpD